MCIKSGFYEIKEKLAAARQSWVEKKLFRKILQCTEAEDRQTLRKEIDYVRALTEKAYYEEKLSFEGYMRVYSGLEIAEKSILKNMRRTGLQAAS